jgi:hypothetical protein
MSEYVMDGVWKGSVPPPLPDEQRPIPYCLGGGGREGRVPTALQPHSSGAGSNCLKS